MTDVVEYGKQTSPTAGTAIAATGTLSHGQYRVTVYAILTGTVSSSDLNNIELLVGATVISTLAFINTAGDETTEPPIVVDVPAAGAAISVEAVANATSGAIYSVMLVASPIVEFPT